MKREATGTPFQPTLQVAKMQGEYLAKCFAAAKSVQDLAATKPFKVYFFCSLSFLEPLYKEHMYP